jgi:4-amino-4-deoxy-L-arabinose transferase-like glycosyltransferase
MPENGPVSVLPQTKPSTSTGRLVAVSLVALALVIRLAPALVMEGDWTAVRWESAEYLEIGLSAASGHGLVQVGAADEITRRAGITPGYPLLVAAADMTGYGMRAMVVFQALAGTAALVLAFFIARRLAGLWAGVVAAAIMVFDPLQVVACTSLVPATVLGLAILAAVAACLALLDALDRGGRAVWLWAGATGAILAAAIYIDPFCFVLVPAAGVVAAVVRDRRRLLKVWLVVLAATVVVLSPWLLRSAVLLGRPVLATEAGPRFLGADWPEEETPEDTADREAIYNKTVGDDEVRVDHLSWMTGWRRVAAHPGQWLAGYVDRVATIWSPESITRLWPAVTRVTGYTSLLPVAVLSLAGLWALRRKRGVLAILLLAPVAMTLIHAMVGGGAQDRLPLVPILAVLAGVGLGPIVGSRKQPGATTDAR